MKKLAFIVVLFCAAPVAHAQYFERDSSYIREITPLRDYCTNSKDMKMTAHLTRVVLVSVLKSLSKSSMLPQNVANVSDLEKFRLSQRRIDSLVQYLNGFVHEERTRVPVLTTCPSAYMFSLGRKISLPLAGKDFGGSVTLGVVFMPVRIDTFDQHTGALVSSRRTLELSVVAWPAGDFGFKLGGGVGRWRYGLTGIWDLSGEFMKPSQFWGSGIGLSWSPITTITGLNIKAGVLSNSDLPGWADLLYVTVGQEFGAVDSLSTPHGNVMQIFTLSQLLSIFNRSQDAQLRNTLLQLSNKMNQVLKERTPQIGNSPSPDDRKSKDRKSGGVMTPGDPQMLQ